LTLSRTAFAVSIPSEDLYHHYQINMDGIVQKVRDVMGKDFEDDEDWVDEV